MEPAKMIRAILAILALSASFATETTTTATRVIDGDTIETAVGKVRMLWIDTPESHDNAHGPRIAEGASAAACLRTLIPRGATVSLWAPHRIAPDRYGRMLALVTVAGSASSAQEVMIAAGWSPYWRKYGPATEPIHSRLIKAQELAESSSAGAWATAPKYMRDKANERTKPRD